MNENTVQDAFLENSKNAVLNGVLFKSPKTVG